MSARESMATVKSKRGKVDLQPERGIFIIERREHPRFTVELSFDYSRIDGVEEHGGVTTNVSEGGLLAYLPEVVEKGALLKIVILFLKGSELNTIKATAKVVWCDVAAMAAWGEHRYGFEFQSFNRGGLDKLRILIKKAAETHAGQK